MFGQNDGLQAPADPPVPPEPELPLAPEVPPEADAPAVPELPSLPHCAPQSALEPCWHRQVRKQP